jgi:hypothetical protein
VLSREVAQFSNSVSDCLTFGPFPGGNPDYDKQAIGGMIPDTVIFHAAKDDRPALELFSRLSSLMKTRLGHEFPPDFKSHYHLNPGFGGRERIMWLQFGNEVKWNSQP